MKGKVKYTNERIGRIRIVSDLLPPPDKLAFRDVNVKVTISLSKASVDFFKSAAKRHHTHYQKMIRHLLDSYATHYQ